MKIFFTRLLSHLAALLVGLAMGTLLMSAQLQTERKTPAGKTVGCACGSELVRLNTLAKIALFRAQMALNTTCFKDPTPTLSSRNITSLRRYLYPEDRGGGGEAVPVGVLARLEQEYIFKKTLFVGVLTRESYLHTRAKALYETWGKEVDKIVFFVGEDCKVPANISYLPIVKLPGIPDKVYPPLKKAFAVMKYMYEHYIDGFNWFMRADDDMYVRSGKLRELLGSMHPYEKVYLGRAGAGRSQDLGRLNLLPHERYCMGGPGIILSTAALRKLGPHLDGCLEAIFLHDQGYRQEWNDDDVEIGRCMSRKLGVQCSTSVQSRMYFHFDYSGEILNPLQLWTSPQYQDMITVHPVKNPDNMRSVHHFYKTVELQAAFSQLQNTTLHLNQLCSSLPVHLQPPSFASSGCHLQLPSCTECTKTSILASSPTSSSYLINKQLITFHNPADKFDLALWTTFDSNLMYEVSAVTPQHVPYPTLKADIDHLLGLLRPYFNAGGGAKRNIDQIPKGYVRYNPRVGREYILTLKLIEVDNPDKVSFQRVRLVRPLGREIAITEEEISPKRIHVILPIETCDTHFSEFIAMYEESAQEKLNLIAVVFSERDAKLVKEALQGFTRQHPHARLTVVTGSGEFSVPRAVDVGMQVVKNSDDLVFLAEVDVRIKPRFWQSCRTNTVPGQRVYFPVAFWVYDSDFSGTKDDKTIIRHWNGQWAFYSVRHVCIHKQDYDSIGGYGNSQYSDELFERTITSHLEAMQAPDPHLFKLWGSKTCGELPPGRGDICRQFKYSASFDQTELADYLSELAAKKYPGFKYPITPENLLW